MIEIRHIRKKYGDQVVLDDFSLSIGEGELVVLMGPSGCGKTTLCRLLLGLEKPDAGEIAGLPERVSAAFQAPVLCGHLSAIDNLRLVLPRLSREEALSALSDVGLAEAAHTRARDLSGGMARRVSLLRALLSDAPLLVLDEPFSGLDEDNHARAADLVRRLRGGRTTLCVSHDPADAALLAADRVVYMGNGGENGETPDGLFESEKAAGAETPDERREHESAAESGEGAT